MKRLKLITFILITALFAHSQNTNQVNTGKFTGIFTTPKSSETNREDLKKAHWNITLQSIYEKNKTDIFHTKAIKKAKLQEKINSLAMLPPRTASKTTGATSTIGTNFKGNELKTWTPTDNSIAVSNGGKIVSCINYGIEYYDTAGTNIVINQTWDAFVNNTALNQAKFDPRVIYDNKHDRFVVVLLHGFSSATSKILVCFSKTNDPVDGWNIYQLSGNPYQDTSWTDFPTIGLNDDDLFINGNRFGDAPNYDWKETYIYQVGLAEGYAGTNLNYGLWNNIYGPDGQEGITCYPASDGQGKSLVQKMYFVHMNPDSGSHVYLYQINGNLLSSNKSMTASQYAIPHYEVCANAFQQDPTTGNIDSLSTGSAWTQNAFLNGNAIHFTSCADFGMGWCGINYGRIYLDSNKAVVTSYGELGTDFAYPAVASFGYNDLDQGAAIAYVRSDSSITPENGVISLDHAMTWSGKQTVKTGDTVVNILYPPNYPIMPERWGDYTGICRKFNSAIPQVWMAAAYGANTLPRRASYGTWIAQIVSNDPVLPLSTSSITKSNAEVNVFPNPANELFSVEFKNEKAGKVDIGLYDMQGRLVKKLFSDIVPISMNRLSFNKLMLSKGTYILVVQMQNTQSLKTKLVIE